tara:strand:- start:421 stop:663 length:243 start_codon:yes stop_codon:yes gene_type:complete
MEYMIMATWRSRIFTCKSCKKSVEIFPKEEYICKYCDAPLLSNQPKRRGFYIGMNPMARQTQMEFSTQSMTESIKEFQKK